MTTAIRRGLVVAGCAVLVGFFMLVRWVIDQPIDESAKSAARPLEYEVASGMSVWYRHLQAESMSFKSCWIRRKRMGAFVLGAFRDLELEDVNLNLPLPAEKTADDAKDSSAPASQEAQVEKVMERIGLSDIGKFSGVKIKGLRVGRITETGAEPIFSAEKAETKGRALYLSRCEIFRDGKRELVPDARVKWNDGMQLVWSGGSLDLPDLMEDQR